MKTLENTLPLTERHNRVVGVGRDRPDLNKIARARLDVAISSEDRHDGA